MTLLGGMGTIFGPMVGAGIIITMQSYLASLGARVTVAQGVVFVVAVLMFREGIVGVLSKWLKKPLCPPAQDDRRAPQGGRAFIFLSRSAPRVFRT